MGKFISGFATKSNLEKWQDYSAKNGQETARKSEGPTRQDTNPDQVRFHQPSGRQGVDADAGLVTRRGGHKYPEITAGGGSAEGRLRLSAAQKAKR